MASRCSAVCPGALRNVYPGIDLVYYGKQGQLEYDFEVAPGSDPKQVALKFQGSRGPSIDASGDLIVEGSDVRLQAPRVYQRFGTEERSVEGRFELRGEKSGESDSKLGTYDRSRDSDHRPGAYVSTYLGGSGEESLHNNFKS